MKCNKDKNMCDKLKKCDVFTPLNITEIMSNYLYNSGTLLEPSVGVGDLLKCLDTTKYNIDAYDIEKSYLDEIKDPLINKKCCDFLKENITRKYKNIILNPPYIRFQDLDEDYRKFLKSNYPLLKSGNIDIYQAFVLKCLECLEDDGVMVAITPSSWLYNKSCIAYKNYLIDNQLISEIIDFGSKKVFNGISVYCTITVFKKYSKSYTINGKSVEIHTKKGLNKLCNIKYGIATLRDNIYIHDKKLFDEPCWKQIYKVSKNIIRYIIYPYEDGVIIGEEQFKKDNPQTYDYLLGNKEELSKRDKGKKKYETWYAYGRKQGIKMIDNNGIFISTMGPKDFKMYVKEPILFYSGIVIETKEIKKVMRLIDNNRDFIYNNCSKRGDNWINISPSVILKI